MNKITKYLFINIVMVCGEYEFNQKTVHAVTVTEGTEAADLATFADMFALNQCGDNDEVAASVDSYAEVTEEEFKILNKYL